MPEWRVLMPSGKAHSFLAEDLQFSLQCIPLEESGSIWWYERTSGFKLWRAAACQRREYWTLWTNNLTCYKTAFYVPDSTHLPDLPGLFYLFYCSLPSCIPSPLLSPPRIFTLKTNQYIRAKGHSHFCHVSFEPELPCAKWLCVGKNHIDIIFQLWQTVITLLCPPVGMSDILSWWHLQQSPQPCRSQKHK